MIVAPSGVGQRWDKLLKREKRDTQDQGDEKEAMGKLTVGIVIPHWLSISVQLKRVEMGIMLIRLNMTRQDLAMARAHLEVLAFYK